MDAAFVDADDCGTKASTKEEVLGAPSNARKKKENFIVGSIDSLRLLFNATDKRRNFASENNMAGSFGLFSKSAVSKKIPLSEFYLPMGTFTS